MISDYEGLLHDVTQDSIVFDLEAVKSQCRRLKLALPDVDLRFAVKACPIPELLQCFVASGLGFDIASPNELALVCDANADIQRVHYGNTIKSADNIVTAYRSGVRDFVSDSLEDLSLVARLAPGSRVFCRVYTSGEGAIWGLGHKFGCTSDKVITLLLEAKRLGLVPAGISAHVGSQQMQPQQWTCVFLQMRELAKRLLDKGVRPLYFNLGGGLPGLGYKNQLGRSLTPRLGDMFVRINQGIKALRQECGYPVEIVMEPGRHLVADAGVIACRVVRLSRRRNYSGVPEYWLYLSCGKFNGLFEADQLQYRFVFPEHKDCLDRVPAVIAGPTCDSDDVMNSPQTPIWVPRRLRSEDRVWIMSCGAYSASYSTAFFNGFKPLAIKVKGREEA